MRRIEFKKLHAENTLCFKDLDIDLNNLKLAIIDGLNLDDNGSNGSGKTTIEKIFYYAITGTTPDGLETDDILSDFIKENSKVVLEFSVNNINYCIERYRNHKKHKNNLYFFQKLEKESTSLTRHKVNDTQAEIYNVLGIDHKQLLLMTIFSTDTIHFAKCKPADRRQLFINLFPDVQEFSQTFAPLFKTKRDMCRIDISETENQIVQVTAKYDAEYHQYQLVSEEIEQQKTKQNPNIKIEAEQINNQIKIFKDEMKEFVKQIRTGCPELPPNANPNSIIELLNQVRAEKDNLIAERDLLKLECISNNNEYTRAMDGFKREMKYAMELKASFESGECENCGSELDIKNPPLKLKNKMDETKKKLNLYKEEGLTLQKKNVELSEKIEVMTAPLPKLIERISLLTIASDLVTKFMTNKNKVEKLEIQLTYLKENIDIKNDQLIKLKQKQDELDSKVKALEVAKTNLNKTLSKLEAREQLLDYLIKISLNDIPTYLLNSYLQDLEQEASTILNKLFPGMKILLTDIATSKKGIERPELSLKIQNNLGYDKKYDALSSAEKQMVDISLLFGLQRVIELRTGCSSNIVFLDEIIDLSSDELRATNILNFIYEEIQHYSSTFLISHKKVNKQWADTRLTCVKKNGITTLS